MKPTYEQLEQERDELAAQVERFADVYYDAFVAGGEWFMRSYEQLEQERNELAAQVEHLKHERGLRINNLEICESARARVAGRTLKFAIERGYNQGSDENELEHIMRRFDELLHDRDDALALVIRYQSLLECAIRGEEIIVGDAILIGIDAELADEIEESFDESPKAALAALKAQWQAEQYSDGMPAQKAFWEGFERGAINGPANIRSHWNEWRAIRQHAQDPGND